MCNRKILSDSTDGLALTVGHGIMMTSKAEKNTSGAIVRDHVRPTHPVQFRTEI